MCRGSNRVPFHVVGVRSLDLWGPCLASVVSTKFTDLNLTHHFFNNSNLHMKRLHACL